MCDSLCFHEGGIAAAAGDEGRSLRALVTLSGRMHANEGRRLRVAHHHAVLAFSARRFRGPESLLVFFFLFYLKNCLSFLIKKELKKSLLVC